MTTFRILTRHATRRVFRSLVIAGSLALGSVPASVAAAGNSCDTVLTHAAYNIRTTLSDEAVAVSKYFNHCQKNFDALTESELDQAELNLFSKISGAGSLSRERRIDQIVEWCETNHDVAQTNRHLYEASQTVYAESVRAWEACNRLLIENVRIEPDISPDKRSVQFSLRYTGGSSGIALQKPFVQGFSCTTTDQRGKPIRWQDGNLPQITNEAIAMRCTRTPPTVQTRNGQDYAVVPSGVVGILTAQDHVMLSFAEEWSPGLPEDRAVRLERGLEALQARFDQLQGRFLTPTSDVVELSHHWGSHVRVGGVNSIAGWGYCPDGWYVAAIRSYDEDYSNWPFQSRVPCTDCITGVGVQCKQLPIR